MASDNTGDQVTPTGEISKSEFPVQDSLDEIYRGNDDNYFGLADLKNFKEAFVNSNRGKALFLVRFQSLEGMDLLKFITLIRHYLDGVSELSDLEYGFHYIDKERCLLLGLSPLRAFETNIFPNVDNAIGRFHEESLRTKLCSFHFGISRTQSNYISSTEEIFDELFQSSLKNLNDNLVRWSWTLFNRANTYFSGGANEAVIQPTVYFDKKSETFSVKGGEVFVGGNIYSGYHDLINDIPEGQDLDRIELLILEKLIIACEHTPGVLKFNISPQTLLDTFSNHDRVARFNRLLHARGLNPACVRLELVEKAYDEQGKDLKEVCMDFFHYGITFAADDFGVKSQSHQVVLTLGQMIKEFKLDPISFKFKPEEDKTKFLDNMAFIAYCKRLADNRDAFITAEAVEDLETLRFLLEHRINQYQANIFCGKLPMQEYRDRFHEMKDLPLEKVTRILSDPDLMAEQLRVGNIFTVAAELD